MCMTYHIDHFEEVSVIGTILKQQQSLELQNKLEDHLVCVVCNVDLPLFPMDYGVMRKVIIL